MDQTFDQLYESSVYKMRLTAFRLTRNQEQAEDLMQETALKAFRYYDKYIPGTNFSAWITTIMKNHFINDYYRSVRARNVFVEKEDPYEMEGGLEPSRNQGDQKFIMNDIQLALNAIPMDYSVPFVKHFEGFKYHEIAQELGLPIGTVKTRIHMARRELKKILKLYKDR